MSTQTMASRRAYQLADAIADMAQRQGQAELMEGLSMGAGAREDAERWYRTARRRYKALLRLTAALRDLPMKEEK